MDIYQLAVQYLIPRLEQVCIQYLEFKISKQNVLDALFNADKMRYRSPSNRHQIHFNYNLRIHCFSLKLIKEYCLAFIVKEENFYEIVMSGEFVNLDKPLMVEIIRKRLNPGKNIEIKYDKTGGKWWLADFEKSIFFPSSSSYNCNLQAQRWRMIWPFF